MLVRIRVSNTSNLAFAFFGRATSPFNERFFVSIQTSQRAMLLSDRLTVSACRVVFEMNLQDSLRSPDFPLGASILAGIPANCRLSSRRFQLSQTGVEIQAKRRDPAHDESS